VKFLTIAGKAIGIESLDSLAARTFDDFLKDFGLAAFPACPEQKLDCTIEISTNSPPALPGGLRSFDVPGGLCYTDGLQYFLDLERGRIEIAPSERRVTAWFTGNTPEYKSLIPYTFLSSTFVAALRRSSLYVLHAAGVVEPASGAGVILMGVSGSGKSSLAIRLVRSGWRYLSDDSIVLSDSEGQVKMHPLRRFFALSDSALEHCRLPVNEGYLERLPLHGTSKRSLDLQSIFPRTFTESCAPKVICFPRITYQRSSHVERLEPSQAMSFLIRHCPWSGYDNVAAPHFLQTLSRLTSQASSYILHAGHDLLDDPDQAAVLLASCVGE
jgi:hypothetical protein